MKVVIADGVHEADYLIGLFNTKKNNLIVINEDEDVCRYLSFNHDIPVMNCKCTKENELQEAVGHDCDLFIALSDDDYKNYVACRAAKKFINANRSIARVSNPKNVAIFKELGIDKTICSTYLLGEQIRNLSSIENLISTLSFEDDKILIIELRISEDLDVVGKSLADINLSELGTISSIIRHENVIIPNGQTVLETDDNVVIVTTVENEQKLIDIIQRKKK